MKLLRRCAITVLVLGKIMSAAVEETYIEINAKHLKNDFYRVLYDEEADKIYIGAGSFIDFLRIRELRLEKKSYKIIGYVEERTVAFNKSISKKQAIEEEEDIFIPLEEAEKVFDLKNVKWNQDKFILEVTPNFKLPYEYLVDAKQQRDAIDAYNKYKITEEQEIYQTKNKLFSPGMLKLTYLNDDIKNNDYGFEFDYGTQLLYGEFEISQRILPETDLNYVRQRYPNFLGGRNALLLGDSFLEVDSYYNIDKSIRGISLLKDEYYGTYDGRYTVVEGDSYGANLVELYRNGMLIDFIRNPGGSFRFITPTLSSTDSYTLKLYNNTEVETRSVYIIGNNRVLNKNETDYVIQIGQSVNDDEMQYLVRYKYGVTNNLTLGLGAGSFRNSKKDEFDVIEGLFAYRTPFVQYPTLFSGNIVEDIKNDQINFKGFIEQKIGKNTLAFEYENYGSKTSELINKETLYGIRWGRSYNRAYTSLGYVRDTYKSEDRDRLYLNLNYIISQTLDISVSSEYQRRKGPELMEDDTNNNHSVQLNYSGINGFYTILNFDVGYSDNGEDGKKTSLEIVKNFSNNPYFRNWDFSLEVGHSTYDGTFFSLNLAYIFDGLVYIEFPDIRYDKQDKMQIGGRVEKTFYLGEPTLPLNNNSVRDGWIKGKVFIDENNNGKYDTGETLLKDVKVSAGGSEGITNKEGRYVLGDISPGRDPHQLTIDRSTIDSMLNPIKEEILVKGNASSGHNLNLGVVPVSIISGSIYAENGISDSRYTAVLGGVEILLLKDNVEVAKTVAEMGGYYMFEDILPGRYEVRIEYKGVRYSPIFDRTKALINVRSGKEGDYYEDNNFFIKSAAINQ